MRSNFERKAARSKKQTRLSLTPADRSSSPSTALPPANVRYELPGGRRQVPSSSLRHLVEGSESEDILSSALKDDFTMDSQVPHENGIGTASTAIVGRRRMVRKKAQMGGGSEDVDLGK